MAASPRTMLAGLVILAGLVNAQTRAVRLSGRVTDQTGTPIPGATVKCKLAGIDVTPVILHTHQDGTFALQTEPLRRYELTFEMAGFKKKATTIDLGADSELNTGDLVLQVADASIADTLTDTPIGSPPNVTIYGIGGATATLSLSDLTKLTPKTVKVTTGGVRATYEGVLLIDALKKVHLPLGEKFDNTAASYYVTAEGHDGHEAVFAWAELDPTFMNKPVYLVTTRDGKALSDELGPFQVIVPGEKTSARWVRQVTSLKLHQAN